THLPALSPTYPLSLHDALPISFRTRAATRRTSRASPSPPASWPTSSPPRGRIACSPSTCTRRRSRGSSPCPPISSPRCPCSASRSEEHTSELQSLAYLVCRLLL